MGGQISFSPRLTVCGERLLASNRSRRRLAVPARSLLCVANSVNPPSVCETELVFLSLHVLVRSVGDDSHHEGHWEEGRCSRCLPNPLDLHTFYFKFHTVSDALLSPCLEHGSL